MIFSYNSIKNKIKKRELKKILENDYLENINNKYIKNILSKNKILFYNIDSIFDIKNVTTILVYKQKEHDNIIIYYILLLGTHKDIRNVGYGNNMLNEFIEMVSKKKRKMNKKIIIESVIDSIKFYEKFGFIEIDNKNEYNINEEFNSSSNTIVLEYNL